MGFILEKYITNNYMKIYAPLVEYFKQKQFITLDSYKTPFMISDVILDCGRTPALTLELKNNRVKIKFTSFKYDNYHFFKIDETNKFKMTLLIDRYNKYMNIPEEIKELDSLCLKELKSLESQGSRVIRYLKDKLSIDVKSSERAYIGADDVANFMAYNTINTLIGQTIHVKMKYKRQHDIKKIKSWMNTKICDRHKIALFIEDALPEDIIIDKLSNQPQILTENMCYIPYLNNTFPIDKDDHDNIKINKIELLNSIVIKNYNIDANIHSVYHVIRSTIIEPIEAQLKLEQEQVHNKFFLQLQEMEKLL